LCQAERVARREQKLAADFAQARPPPPHLVLIGHAASLTPY
jgi:hypothetical protein